MKWSELSMVQLKTLIEAEEWFKLSSGTFQLNTSEANWNGRPTDTYPTIGHIKLTYKGLPCEMNVQLDGGKFRVNLRTPYIGKHGPGRRSTRSTSNLFQAADRIREFYGLAIECLDEDYEEAKQEAIRKQRSIIRTKELAETLGVTLRCDYEGYVGQGRIHPIHAFQASRSFALAFQEQTDGTFSIENIEGTYTLDQIHELINFLCKCPQVMADRLLSEKKGKRR